MTEFNRFNECFPNRMSISELRSTISIIELASYYGYQPQLHKGQARPVLVHPAYQDSILIKNPQYASQQVYQRTGDFSDKGTLIDFIRNRLTTVFARFNKPGQHPLRNVTDVLYDYLQLNPNATKESRPSRPNPVEPTSKQPFMSEQFDLRPLEDDNYLIQRHISLTILQRPEFVGKVLSQMAYYNPQTRCIDSFLIAKEHPKRVYRQFSNIAFPYFNGQSETITGLELRNKKLKQHAPGSDRSRSIFVSNPPPKSRHFFVMESTIDALSHRELRRLSGDDQFDSVYFSTGGQLTHQQVDTISGYVNRFTKDPDWVLRLAFDRDVKGWGFDLQFIQQLIYEKLPLRPVPAPTSHYTYELLDEDYCPLLHQALMAQAQASDTAVVSLSSLINQITPSDGLLDKQPICINLDADQPTVSIPKSCAMMSVFCRTLLALAGFNQRVVLVKAQGKDFNEDLMQWHKTKRTKCR